MQECGLGIWHEECNGRPDALEKCGNPEPPPAAGAVADSNHPAAAGGGGELQQPPSLGLTPSDQALAPNTAALAGGSRSTTMLQGIRRRLMKNVNHKQCYNIHVQPANEIEPSCGIAYQR